MGVELRLALREWFGGVADLLVEEAYLLQGGLDVVVGFLLCSEVSGYVLDLIICVIQRLFSFGQVFFGFFEGVMCLLLVAPFAAEFAVCGNECLCAFGCVEALLLGDEVLLTLRELVLCLLDVAELLAEGLKAVEPLACIAVVFDFGLQGGELLLVVVLLLLEFGKFIVAE